MGLTKSQIFTRVQNHLASTFRVLAHPARIAILRYFSRQEGYICNDLVEEIGLAQPTISQHVKGLKHIGLIRGEIEGKNLLLHRPGKMAWPATGHESLFPGYPKQMLLTLYL